MLLIKNGKLYDGLKYFALVVLPAVGALYFALSHTWGLPYGGEVVGSITSVDAFLGVVLHISSTAYNNSDAKYDGTMNVIQTPEKKTFQFEVNGDPNDLDQKDQVVLKVKPVVKTSP